MGYRFLRSDEGQEAAHKMNELCLNVMKQLSCDFVGLALYNPKGKEIKWKYAAGNRNEKYKRITIRYGKGLAGQVVRSGTPLVIHSFPHDLAGKVTDYPIMLAEQLASCMAVPLYFNDKIGGVLVAGHRTVTAYTQEDIAQLREMAAIISENIVV